MDNKKTIGIATGAFDIFHYGSGYPQTKLLILNEGPLMYFLQCLLNDLDLTGKRPIRRARRNLNKGTCFKFRALQKSVKSMGFRLIPTAQPPLFSSLLRYNWVDSVKIPTMFYGELIASAFFKS